MASLPVTEHEPAHTPPAAVAPAATGWSLFRGALAVVVVLLLFGALAWTIFGYATGNFVDSDAKRVLERTKILADRNTEDAKLLHDPASWQDKGKGLVRVPIDRAVDLTMADLKKVQPHPAYPLKDSPPQPANAPTAAGTKGPDVPDSSAGVNPSASNPTVGQPSPAPVAPAPTPAPATSASKQPSPAPAPAPAAAPTAVPAPTLAPTPVPTATPLVGTPAPDNNASNPGTPPVPGTTAQAPAPTAAPAPSAAPATGSQPEPLQAPPSQPTPASATAPATSDAATPTPAPGTPGASPAGTP